MSNKRRYFDDNIEICLTCKFIDEYAFNVRDNEKTPHGWDGSALCCLFNEDKEESIDNRFIISPLWKACKKYERCSEKQADYEAIYDRESRTLIKNHHKGK